MRLLFCALFLCIASCAAHNRLISPTPWSPTPIKVPPCGGGFALTVPQAYWVAGSTVQIQWDVIGDGLGLLNAYLDPLGGTDFNVQLLYNISVPNLGANFFNISVPNVPCTGYNNTCSLQVNSTDGWNECSSISIVQPCTDCTPENPPGPSCVTAVGLNYCSQYNNTKISLGAGFNYQNLDLMVNWTIVEYSAMPIFSHGETPQCQALFKKYLCATVFPTCKGESQTCEEDCNDFKTQCGMEASHEALYDCSALKKCPTSHKKEYEEISAGVGILIVVVIVIAFVFNFIVCRKPKTGYTAIQ